MIGTFSLKEGPGKRTISYGKAPEWTAITAGEGSYVSEANFEFGSTRCHVLIGRYCSIAHRVTFEVGLNHDYHCVTTYPFEDFAIGDPLNPNHAYSANKYQIIIGNDVWIGCDVIIMGGVHIGNGAVIGAGTVVASDVPPYSVVVGNPARVIKYRFAPDVIQRLQKIKWWYWSAEKLRASYALMRDIDKFLRETKNIEVYQNDDETVGALRGLKENAYYIYYMYGDFQMEEAVWHSVMTEYLKKFSQNDKVVLVVELTGKNLEKYVSQMAEMVNAAGDNAPIVVTHQSHNGVSPALFPLIDTFITTKDDPSSVGVDFLADTEAKIVYGLDFEGHIFV